MFSVIQTLQEFTDYLGSHQAVLAYFSTEDCNVCKVLKPRVEEMVSRDFPKIRMVYVEINHSPELAAQNRIFAVPTLVVYFDGKEFFRKSRNFGLNELSNDLERPYSLLYS